MEVPTPELGGSVYVREFSGNERDVYEQAVFSRKDDFRGLRAIACAMGLCDESGATMGFTEAETEALGEKSGAAIDRIFEAIKDISGLNGNAVEEAEGN